MAKLIQLPGARPADEGEALVINHLKDVLPDTYTLIPNAEIAERGRPPFEYDLIVVAPHAVYVVEVKRWRGGIRGDDHTWLVAGGHRRQNPWPTANNKARVLKSQVQRRQPACDPFWVEAVVTIADEQGELDLRGHCRGRVFRYTELSAFLANASALGDLAGDLRSKRAYIEKAIQEAARGRPSGLLRFGDYEVLETLARRDQVAEYLARNLLLRGEEQVRLRVFTYDPYLPTDELAHRQNTICREAEALQTIGSHPNLIGLRGFFSDPRDPNLLIEVTDWSEQGTLRALLASEAPLTLERKLELAQGLAVGLKAAHAAGVVHRDVCPENILIGGDGQPRLMNFDHARLSASGVGTVSPIQRDPDLPRAYLAPELLDPAHRATPAADLYGLGVILFEMLAGAPLYDSPEEALREGTGAGGPATWGAPDVPGRLNELIRRLTRLQPQERPPSADEVLTELQAIRERPSGMVAEAPASAPPSGPREPEPVAFEIGDVIDHKYQVQAVLPPGGSGRVYKVYDSVFDRVYALKVFNDTALSLDWLKKEARTLLDLEHRYIVRVHTWGRLGSGRVYLVSEFVDGENLTAYTSGEKRMPVRQAVSCILQLLAALEAMHPDVDRIETLRTKMESGEVTQEEYEEWSGLQEKGWLHRDIKPANLMLAGETLKLIDFNIAAQARQADRTYTGTPGYMPPDVGLIPWDTSCDLFAVGVVLYELITGHHPYPDRTPNVEDPPADPRQYVPNLTPALAGLLQRAVSVDRHVRYRSARRFRQDLLDLDGVYLQAPPVSWSPPDLELAPDEVGRPDYNPYVTRFLTMHSQARRDNSGTRGLDAVALLTYVETRLDRLLRPAVLDGQYRLVIITGNAGDGKTAFIKNLEAEVDRQGAHVEQVTPNSSTFVHRGLHFLTNYDGSQDEGAERANDQVLTEFFAPFADEASPQADRIHIIAINEGRLIDFFGGSIGNVQFKDLGRQILRFFEPDGAELPPWLLIVDLNQRSVVADDPNGPGGSILERQLQALLRPEFWAPCTTCQWQSRCFIKFNADTLADPVSGTGVRERLRTLFEIVHLRRRLHITMRDLRSALSWLIFRDHTCDDVAAHLAAHPPPDELLPLFYYNAYASDGRPPEERADDTILSSSKDDRLVALLRQIDPAEIANPTADRQLYFLRLEGLQMLPFEGRSSADEALLNALRRDLRDGWESVQSPEAVRRRRAYHAALRRKAFFERRDDSWGVMLPYRNLARFRQATQGNADPSAESSGQRLAELKTLLVQGLSMAEGARNEDLAQRYICLRAGQEPKAKIKSFRLFPADDFRVEVPPLRPAAGRYLEHTPDRLVLYHAPQDESFRLPGARRAELHVSLDVLELLAQIRDGFVPSPNDIRGYFINLVMFKNALAHLPYRRALLTRDDQTFFELALEGTATAVLRRVEAGPALGATEGLP